MKKLILLSICAVLLAGFVWGVDNDAQANKKIHDLSHFFYSTDSKSTDAQITKLFEGKRVYYLDGFDFGNYKKQDPSLDELNAGEISAIRNGVWDTSSKPLPYRVTKADGPYSIIGHSQGGLRALGYISNLKRSYPGDVKNIDAVITISGIDQGLAALDGGLKGFKGRAKEKIDIFGNGLRAAIGVFDLFGIISYITPRNEFGNAIDAFIGLVPRQWRPYYLEAWRNTNDNDFPQLAGMIPGRDYIKSNVVETVDHSYKKKTGEKLCAEWRYTKVLGIKIWYLWIGNVDQYSYYTATETKPKFDSTVPVGFIVGLDSNTIGMDKDAEGKIKDALKGFEIGFGVTEGLHITKCILVLGLVTGSVTYAQDAKRAKELMRDFNSELNDIKRSSSNDGLVALRSQYIPQKFTHPTDSSKNSANLKNPVLGKRPEGYVQMPKHNHVNIVQKIDTFERAAEMVIEGRLEREKQGLRPEQSKK